MSFANCSTKHSHQRGFEMKRASAYSCSTGIGTTSADGSSDSGADDQSAGMGLADTADEPASSRVAVDSAAESLI